MRRLFVALLINMLAGCGISEAQMLHTVDKWVEYIEQLTPDEENSGRIEALYDELSYLAEHPFDINTVTEEELKKLPFISGQQAEDILAHRSRYGKMLSLYELNSVESMDIQSVELLLPFIYIGEYADKGMKLTANNFLKYGKHELLLRYDQCLQSKSGYGKPAAEDQGSTGVDKHYSGEPFYNSIRYSCNFDGRLQAGIAGEKDRGEPFLNRNHKGYDFYSAHVIMKGKGTLKAFIIGDYKSSFGQGLIASNDFTLGRSAVVTQAERRSNGFRRHYSTNEQDFFRGAAATLNFNKVDVSLFYSRRKMDASLSGDSFTSIKTDGLHRLPLDWEKRKRLPVYASGGNIRYASSSLTIGATFVYYSFGKYKWLPDPKPYNVFHFRGSYNFNAGMDYSWKITRGIKFFGEMAFSKNGAVATLNGLLITPVSYISFLALHRCYGKKYQAYYANAFAQRDGVQNEQGVYLGLQFVPFSGWKVSGYADLFRHPWLLYNTDAPSSGKEYMVQVDYSGGENFSVYLRYKVGQKEKNVPAGSRPLAGIEPFSRQRMRLQFRYKLWHNLVCSSSFDGISYNEAGSDDDPPKGMMLAQSIGWQPSRKAFEAGVYCAFFNTEDYNTRISSYEKNIYYAFSTSSFYGNGTRLAATLRWKITGNLALSAKIAQTHYYDRDVIGTGTEAIGGRNKTDVYSTLSWKF